MNATKLLGAMGMVLAFGLFEINAQTVGRKPPKVVLVDYDQKKDDGKLEFEVDVRMADCISHIEITNPNSKKTVKVDVYENDYYLDEENGTDIILRLSLGTLKEILRKREELAAGLTIYSKNGKPIYTNELSLNKADLISTSGTTTTTAQ
jgi:hypothetical protein